MEPTQPQPMQQPVGQPMGQPQPAQPTSTPAPDPSTKKIVIVEDDTSLADIYKTRLELVGYNCSVAGDGIAALYFIMTQKPDLVLLDLMVPDIAGDEIL